MLTVAATEYMVGQNEPSKPYLLDLACPANPTKEELIAAVLEAGQNLRDEDLGDEDEEFEIVLITDNEYCDIGCEYDDDTYLFIGLPDHVRELLNA